VSEVSRYEQITPYVTIPLKADRTPFAPESSGCVLRNKMVTEKKEGASVLEDKLSEKGDQLV
jgi:hypothetical protein